MERSQFSVPLKVPSPICTPLAQTVTAPVALRLTTMWVSPAVSSRSVSIDGVPFGPVPVERVRTSSTLPVRKSPEPWPRVKLRAVELDEMLTTRAGPYWLRLAGRIHTSKVYSPDATISDETFDAGSCEAISTSWLIVNPVRPQATRDGVLMCRSSGSPTPDTSWITVPLPSLKSPHREQAIRRAAVDDGHLDEVVRDIGAVVGSQLEEVRAALGEGDVGGERGRRCDHRARRSADLRPLQGER
jgi:hypothetical protein